MPTPLSPHDLNDLQAMMLSAGSLSSVMQTPWGEQTYRAMSVPERLEMLQDGGLTNLNPNDTALLKLLRMRREHDAAFMSQQARAQLLRPPAEHTVSDGAGVSLGQGMRGTFQQAADSMR